MSTMQLHIDGSSVRAKSGARRWALGWALVVSHGEFEAEVEGATQVPQELNGYHEMVAFVEAALYASARGVEPENLVVYTDDENIGYANGYLHPDNYAGARSFALNERLDKLCSKLYCEATRDLVLRYLRGARIHKLKGHSFLVYQERADYLARQCAWRLMEGTPLPSLSFMDWLAKGLPYYTRDSVDPKTWHAPFVQEALAA